MGIGRETAVSVQLLILVRQSLLSFRNILFYLTFMQDICELGTYLSAGFLIT